MNCKNCLYWNRSTDESRHEFGYCVCDSIKETEFEFEFPVGGLVYWADRCCSASLLTHELFGCIHYK